MQLNALSLTGDPVSLEIRCMRTILPAMPRMQTRSKNSGLKSESTCLPLGGMIKATVQEIAPVDLIDPEPGAGYGWLPEELEPGYTDQRFRKDYPDNGRQSWGIRNCYLYMKSVR